MSEKTRLLNLKELHDIDKLRESASKSLDQVSDDRNFLVDVMECIGPYYERIKGKDVSAKVNLYKGFLENDAIETLWQMLTLEFEAIQQTEKRVVVLVKELEEYKSKCAQIATLAARQCDNVDTLRDVVHKALDTAESAKKRDDELRSTISDLKKEIVDLESNLVQCKENLHITSSKLEESLRENGHLKAELEKKSSLSLALEKKSKDLADDMKTLRNKYDGVHYEIVQLDSDLRSNEDKMKKLNADHEKRLKEVRLHAQKEMEEQWSRKLTEINEKNHHSIMNHRHAQNNLEAEFSEAKDEVQRKQDIIDKLMLENKHLREIDKKRGAKLARNILASIYNTQDSETSITREATPGNRFQCSTTQPARSRSQPRSQETQTKTSANMQRGLDPVIKSRPTNLRSARK